MPHPFSRFSRLSRCRAKEICETFGCFPKSTQIIRGKRLRAFWKIILSKKLKIKRENTYPFCSKSALKLRKAASQLTEPAAIFVLGWKHAEKARESNFSSAGPPRSRSIEMKVKISLSTSGKLSNFRADYFLNVMVYLKKTRYAYYMT